MKVVLVSINAKPVHFSLAPWCLKAHAETAGFSGEIRIIEKKINDPADQILAAIAEHLPDLVGFSVYIWNVACVREVGAAFRKLKPDARIILGGPEVSFQEDLTAYPFADAIIQGPGESAFSELLLAGGKPRASILSSSNVPFTDLPSPLTDAFFQTLSRQGSAGKIVYYESARGCPFRCSYCLSSLSESVQVLPLERVLEETGRLAVSGTRLVKFTDRTFNADPKRAARILQYILGLDTSCVFHFEVVPELLNDELMLILEAMPPGRVQLEAGIQSLHPRTLEAIGRVSDPERALHIMERVARRNNVHVHLDLIAGLPYETAESFQTAVDECLRAQPHTLQLGFLKLLKGSAVRRDRARFGLLAFDDAPYEVFQTDTLPYADIRRLKAAEEVIDRFYNTGLFTRSLRLSFDKLFPDAFAFLESFHSYLREAGKPRYALKEAYSLLYRFLILHGGGDEAAHCVKLDVLGHGERALLPPGIDALRDSSAEMAWMRSKARVRVERYTYDGLTRIYDLSRRHPVTGEYMIVDERPS
ncbi:MAG: B12-binding domain-containing radical SAM protein [Clostridia bacterium]|nr:B12-binding domain-containing radical SAM protein [Clostridia bacterium]